MNLIEKEVLPGDYCTGCGACAHARPDRYKIDFDNLGMLKASTVEGSHYTDDLEGVDYLCPFTSVGPDETRIADDQFPSLKRFNNVGRYEECYLGYVAEDNYRGKGSSGGFGKWIQAELIKLDYIDRVIQVAYSNSKDRIYDFRIFKNQVEVIEGARSAYYPVSMDKILKYIEENPGRYSVTAVPCFAKALRLSMNKNPILNERVRFIIGIICGHLKSKFFAEALSWQVGVHPDNLAKLDFRGKIPGKKANEKGIIATDISGIETKPKSSKELFGGNWGHNLFKYKACDYCDDVIAETADCAIGDAWLPEVLDDHAGNNVVVVRNRIINEIIVASIEKSILHFKIIDPEKVVESQLGGIRHRNEGLSLRLHDDIIAGTWFPKKRIVPSLRVSKDRARIYRIRVELRDISSLSFKQAKKNNDFEKFQQSLTPLIRKLEYRPVWRRILSKVKRIILSKVSNK